MTATIPVRAAPGERPASVARGGRLAVVLAVVVSVAPTLLLVPYYLTHLARGYPVTGDHALIELQVRAIGHYPVLVGPYSREGWHHPGPALYYLLVGPYRLLGASSVALPVVALLVNAACVAALAVITYRRLGARGALVLLVVLALYLRLVEPGFWRDAWNPMIPVLPLAVMVVLCWSLLAGDLRWSPPLTVGLGSFCVQCHIAFFLPVAGVLGATAAVLIGRAGRGGDLAAALRRRVRILGITALVLAVMWAPPVAQQLWGQPGNLGALWHYLRDATPDTTVTLGFQELSTQVGSVPAYLTGRLAVPPPSNLMPAQFAWWTGGVALGCFVAAVAVAIRLRLRALLHLALLATVVSLAGVAAVARISGTVFAYLVQWTAVAGVLVWTMIGGTAVAATRVALARRRTRAASQAAPTRPVPADATSDGTAPAPPTRVLIAVAGVAVLVAAVLSGFTVRETLHATPGAMPQAPPLTADILRWLGPRGQRARVHVDPAPGPFVDGQPTDQSAGLAPGIVLDLRKHGVAARASLPWGNAYGSRLVDDSTQDDYLIAIAPVDHPPSVGGQLIAVENGYAAYSVPVPGRA